MLSTTTEVRTDGTGGEVVTLECRGTLNLLTSAAEGDAVVTKAPTEALEIYLCLGSKAQCITERPGNVPSNVNSLLTWKRI